jgi:glycyl-tRNA synthetase beta chain
MPHFLLELLSEEIPARMQPRARDDLARLFEAELAKSGLKAGGIETYSTPRRLALIARDLPPETQAVSEELKGPRTSAPPQALEGFLRKTGLTQDQLTDRDGVWFAVIDKPGRATSEVLAEAIPAIVRAFPWPKSMRWGAASQSTESLRWVRPLQGIVALLGEEIVNFEIDGIASGAATVGHRFHHPGRITIGSAEDYAAKLRACHVIVDHAEREAIVATGATTVAAQAGLTLVRDEALLAENAGLTEWPVPLLGSFDPSFLEVPPEVIQLTMAVNQKYFALQSSSPAFAGEGDHAKHGGGASRSDELSPPLRSGPSTAFAGPLPRSGEEQLAPNFICTANLDPRDQGRAIVAGNQKVLAARLSDAKFFWEQDLKVRLEDQAKKLDQIVFHEKLGTVADKVERVAKLARWLVDEGIVKSSPERGGGPSAQPMVEGAQSPAPAQTEGPLHHQPAAGGPPPRAGEDLATLAETAARLCKADLVTGMVGEFPELQGVMGGYYARAQGHPDAVADAIRDHYKPVGQGDEVPTAPVTVAVSLADKLDTTVSFLSVGMTPTGSKDPFALRRAALGIIGLIVGNGLRISMSSLVRRLSMEWLALLGIKHGRQDYNRLADLLAKASSDADTDRLLRDFVRSEPKLPQGLAEIAGYVQELPVTFSIFLADRLKVQQREAGVRHDLIDAVFALGGEDDLVRLLARVNALQAFVETAEGRDLLAGYKRAANILKKEGWPNPSPASAGEGQAGAARQGEGSAVSNPSPSHSADAERVPPSPGTGEGFVDGIPQTGEEDPLVMAEDLRNALSGHTNSLSYTPLPEEQSLIAALDSAEPRARAAVEAEDFEGAMSALASLRAPVDAFFEKVTVNDADRAKREARLNLLARMRDAVHQVADFSRIEG